MSAAELLRRVPEAPASLAEILDPDQGSLEPPIRSEIFGAERFAQHGRSLGETHRAMVSWRRWETFFPRLKENIRVLREAHRYIAQQASTGYEVSPAAEWLLDNFHLIEAQLKEVHEGLPRRYFRDLPVLQDPPLAGLPRVYGVAWAFVAHTDGAFDEQLLIHFLNAYQETRALTLGELWALPTTLRVVLIENLRRLAERVAANKAARELANLCCDRIDAWTPESLGAILAILNRRGVGLVFLGQVAQRVHEHRSTSSPEILDWLAQSVPDLAAMQSQLPVDQAADNLSVSNAISSLRGIGDADWSGLVGQTSGLMRLMMTAPTFAAERDDTRDDTLHAIERLSRRSRRGELEVAQTLLDLMRAGPEASGAPHAASEGDTAAPDGLASAVPSYWLRGRGRSTLLRSIGVPTRSGIAWREVGRRSVLPAYLGTLAIATVALVSWMLSRHSVALPSDGAPLWLAIAAGTLMLFPASEMVVAVINRLISESTRPTRLPRLALVAGIGPDQRVMVVIPALLTSADAAHELAHRLEQHYLANPQRHAQFALLSDHADAPTEHRDGDAALLQAARAAIEALNLRHPALPGDPTRFLLLHRERRFSESEQRWIGWERKRGKLEQLIAALAQGATSSPDFVDLGELSRLAPDTPYVVTLDSDTQLPPGRLAELVGVAAHPHNQPRLDATGRRVVGGYAILQPKVVTPLPAPERATLFHWLFAGQCGIDPYSAATSELYQDLFREGSFTGKGLLDVRALHAVLGGRLPEAQVLSHDLLEGSIARCAALTDVMVIEDAPFHADVAASRVHRWTRGDWQLLPLLAHPGRFDLRAINRWKMIDNLRRSLVAPMSLGTLALALGTPVLSPWAALALVLGALCAGPLLGAVAGLAPSRDELALRHFYRGALAQVLRAVCTGLWGVAQLLQQSLQNVDAIVRALYRSFVSRRHLLEWTTAASAEAAASNEISEVVRKHWTVPIAALVLGAALLAAAGPQPALALALCLLWGGSPVLTWWVSRPFRRDPQALLSTRDRGYLEGVARDTWRLFERCVGPDDHHLPPDNLQIVPHPMLARRTSPTNIGLYLLATACARQFGFIGSHEMLERIEATLATLGRLQRHRGHFLNWYDTATAQPLLPLYVSTVDSGNLSGHLLAVAQACLEHARAPTDDLALRRALAGSAQRLGPLLPALHELSPDHSKTDALVRLMSLPDPVALARGSPQEFELLMRDAEEELAAQLPSQDSASAARTAHDRLAWRLADHLTTLRSAQRDVLAAGADADTAAQGLRARLRSAAQRCQQIAWEADFRFLYHSKRQLFHIGLRVHEQQLDASYYDLLASESRLTSLLAIARGDVPTRHWTALGRPFYAVGSHASLRSWSGSMFEYLMPTLVIREPVGSVLRDACEAAVAEQMAFGQSRDVPWGISESAYAASDHTLAYQYAPQGVPRLALRRTPADELVIAPYAGVLASLVAPQAAVDNLRRLDRMSARGRYGFIEALDYTPVRQSGAEPFTRVETFMAHHQGMSVVAFANLLLDGAAQRWGMADPHLESVSSLLHERIPREVSVLHAPPLAPPALAAARRSGGLVREIVPGMAAVLPTHLLSNGRYTVALRPNGAGWSRLGRTGLTRWRDDALRDQHGSFFHLRWDRQPRPMSLTQHPAPDPAADYRSEFHADRVCFDARWSEVAAHTTVWVSPEDDIEFRRVELRNLSERSIDFELMSAFEVTLSDDRADEAHPAFANLFVRAQWLAASMPGAHPALLYERKPRLHGEPGMHMAHFVVADDAHAIAVTAQTDRLRWLGRNHESGHPQALLGPTLRAQGALETLDTGLDPVCVLGVRTRLAAGAKVRLTFCTAASVNPATLHAVVDKYRQASHIERASMMSATLAGIRRRELRLTPENVETVQTLTSALVQVLTRPASKGRDAVAAPALAEPNASATVCDRRLLWRHGISGDKPIVLASAGMPQGLGLLRSLAQALRVWSFSGLACDLVVVNAEPASYLMALQREIGALRERHLAEANAQENGSIAGFFLLRAEELSADELSTLRMLARVRLQADGRPLAHHVQEWRDEHEAALEERTSIAQDAVATLPAVGGSPRVPLGEFSARTGEFRFDVSAFQRPRRPWVNVLANPDFGAQISEAGGGYTWALNSRLNQLTPWSNDPVGDPPGEWFLIEDLRSGQSWSVAPSAWGDATAGYAVAHGQGYSVITHRRGDLDISAHWCVDPQTSVKQVRVRIVNRGQRTQRLRVAGIAEWVMGANRVDRLSVHTASHLQRLPAGAAERSGPGRERRLSALLCTQRDRAAGFGEGTAFFGVVGDADELDDWTCDRRECFDARGRLVLPEQYGRRSGYGLDPCAALASRVTLAAGATVERVFLLGFGATAREAVELANQAAVQPAAQRLESVRAQWDRLLGATTVRTPDPLFDALVNRWLLYQTVACRMWARAGFYQAGGAYGYRDQLQDAMALAWAEPALLRRQIVLGASRQFEAGDVQHWWHAPTGAGVRTHFSDDLLWLPYACAHYVRSTGDASVLDEAVPFLEGIEIPPGAEDAYYVPGIGHETASVYEHAARAIDRSLRVGEHGLPLMGTGDWNDGMNRVGHEGRGESVWLAWFLCDVVAKFLPIAQQRGDAERAQRWLDASIGWKTALNKEAWDGQWYKRAFFDDGSPLGSHAAPECRIDLIAQAWAVLSQAAPPANQRMALAAIEQHLVDAEHGLVRLLDPPLQNAEPSAGYIQAYPPGVRENGGQYSHAAVWALMAQARAGHADIAWRYFGFLSPAHRSRHPVHGAVYSIEPYVMAGDVYSAEPYAGRGGWSWYTGSAGWLHRAAIESMFGLDIEGGDTVRLTPCLPSHWPSAELLLRREGRTMRFILTRSTGAELHALIDAGKAELLALGAPVRWSEHSADRSFVVVMDAAAGAVPPPTLRVPATS